MLDADAYLAPGVIQHCAEHCATRAVAVSGFGSFRTPICTVFVGRRLSDLIESDPCHPMWIPSPPPAWDIDSKDGSGPINIYGAMCQIMPREAFEISWWILTRVSVGWGGEDISRSSHSVRCGVQFDYTDNDILHLWHPSVVSGQRAHLEVKMWTGRPARRKQRTWRTVLRANGDPVAMRALVDEGRK